MALVRTARARYEIIGQPSSKVLYGYRLNWIELSQGQAESDLALSGPPTQGIGETQLFDQSQQQTLF